MTNGNVQGRNTTASFGTDIINGADIKEVKTISLNDDLLNHREKVK